MRTLVVTNDFPPRRGGIETFVRSLCDDLPAEDVVVYTAAMPGDAAYDAGLPFTVYRDPAGTLLPTPAVRRRVVRVLAQEGCERVVFGAAAPLGLLAPGLRRAGARESIAITHGHEIWWAAVPGARQLLRRIGDSVDVVTYVSDYCRRRIEPALSPAARGRMRLLRPRIDAARFRSPGDGARERFRGRLGIGADDLVVVCVARLVRRKGQDTLIRNWAAVLREFPEAKLVLVGDGPDRRRLRRMIRRRGLDDAVRMAGSVDPGDIPGVLAAADVFALPCRTRWFGLEAEAFGIAYLEAAAAGLPIVGGTSGGAPEAVALARALQQRCSEDLDMQKAGPVLVGPTRLTLVLASQGVQVEPGVC